MIELVAHDIREHPSLVHISTSDLCVCVWHHGNAWSWDVAVGQNLASYTKQLDDDGRILNQIRYEKKTPSNAWTSPLFSQENHVQSPDFSIPRRAEASLTTVRKLLPWQVEILDFRHVCGINCSWVPQWQWGFLSTCAMDLTEIEVQLPKCPHHWTHNDTG